MKDRLSQSRAVRFLKTLTEPELRGFQHLMQSAFFCPDQTVRALLDELIRYYRHTPGKKILDEELLFRRVAAPKRYTPDGLNHLLSSLTELIIQFMALCRIRKHRTDAYPLALAYVAEEADPAVFEALSQKVCKVLFSAPESHSILYQKFRYWQEAWSHWNTIRHRQNPGVYKRMLDAHEQYCTAVSLLLECERRGRASLLTEKTTIGSPDVPADQNLLARLFTQINDLLKTEAPDEPAFLACTQAFRTCSDQIGSEERDAALRLLLNYSIRYGQSGHPVFYRYQYELIVWALEQGKQFSARWSHSDDDFLNIALNFGQKGDVVAMGRFIEHHKQNLPPHSRSDAEHLALAYLHYFEGNFSQAEKNLHPIRNPEIKYGFRKHSLLLRVTYEQGVQHHDFEATINALETCKQYFNRKSLLRDTRRHAYLRLHFFVGKMVDIQLKPMQPHQMQEALDRLRVDLDDPAHVPPIAADWIRKHLERLCPRS